MYQVNKRKKSNSNCLKELTLMQRQCFPVPLTKQAFTKLIQQHSQNPNRLKQLHALILTTGFSIKNSLLTQILTSFTVLGNMHYARQLFDEMHKPRTFLWNTIIKGYVKNGMPNEAALVYQKMSEMGFHRDSFTFPFVVKAVAEIGRVWDGKGVHGVIVKCGVEGVGEVRTELVVMYVRFGELGTGEEVFEGKDLVEWNAFMNTCVQCGYAGKAVELFRRMETEGIEADAVSVVSALSACGQLGCLETGEKIFEFAKEGGVECNVIVDNARLDMYMKCGSVDMAEKLFERMPCWTVISWSTMIVGYAVNGESEKGLQLFSRMQDEEVQPNYVTYLGVLMACSHAGLVSKGREIFDRMVKSGDKSIQPRREHYACMVDLLGRSGRLDEAYNFIRTMPLKPDPAIWGALLGACTIHQNTKLGQLVADALFELAPDIASYHVLLSNMYAAAGRWDGVNKVRLRMRKKGVRKVAGYSSVELGGELHAFYGGDRSHPESTSIYEKLDDLLKQIRGIGYVPKTSSVFHDVESEEKEATISTHSEKLAIAFSLIKTRPESPIRVIKNLRVCEDCHSFSKFVSKLTSREIIMRDKSRYHCFKDGLCSCNDFW